MFDLVHVRSFLEVAERGTVAAAAASLGYTPPAVTQHVAKLERAAETHLFDRINGRLVLTEAGRALVPVARQLVALAIEAGDVVRIEPARERVVVTGVASALAALVVPRLDAMTAGADVDVVEAEDAEARRDLHLGRADVALIQEYPGDEVARDPALAYAVAAVDALRLVLPPTWKASTRIRALGELPWLVNGRGTRCDEAARQILRDAGVDDVRIGADVSDNHLLLELVAAGHGATIVPDLVLAGAVAHVTVSTASLGVARRLVAVTRRRPRKAAVAVLRALLPADGSVRRAGRSRAQPSTPRPATARAGR